MDRRGGLSGSPARCRAPSGAPAGTVPDAMADVHPETQEHALETYAEKLRQLEVLKYEAVHAGSAAAVEKQHAKGKYTARERIEKLLDPGSFQELDVFVRHRTTDFEMQRNRPYADAVVSGHGTIDGRRVCVFSQDFTVFGGSLGEVVAEKMVKVMDLAEKVGCPIIGINDSGGARIQEGVVALGGYGDVFYRNVRASGVVPQISLIMGPCAGGAVYSPAITDFVFMVKEISHMFITGPDVTRTVTGEDVGMEELGGAIAHNTKSGVAHFASEDEDECLEDARYLLSFLPQNNLETPPRAIPTDDPQRADAALDTIVPDNPNKPYDMREVVHHILDDGEFFEVQELFARNIICGFGRLDGQVVGVVGNQPAQLAGVLDIESSEKGSRFVRTCDAFNIPIVTLCDVPGFLPGTAQEWNGIIRHGAKLLYAYAEATVPKLTVITRKSYGGAHLVMGSKQLGADMNFAWPTAEVAVMGAESAVPFIYGHELAGADDPETVRAQRIDEYKAHFANPYIAAERGYIDDVIIPHETRPKLIEALRMLETKRQPGPRRKHGNIPL
jgi:propionyl-CoA carboxylase beta chain